ncbi:tumor necrosis factor receptor superfamily member 6 [Hemicordylus capensis]|uniref:tumor necrosis factor receptor superfamily member 6 n=1 Tax=Hemicordylus capensis TaxID=884348 RepID=UPI002303EB95|nr:tumor necrosis factor receptor superfamily member 6 [Hemicordylus capensis]
MDCLCLFLLFFILDLISAGSSSNNNSQCEQPVGRDKKCPPGYVLCSTNEHFCKKCKNGEEFMDYRNQHSDCLRCNQCDLEHGFEVKSACTSSQNIICKCKPDFFCDGEVESCLHCNPCDKCENGIIVEKCTQTKNTICKQKQNLLWLWVMIPIVIIVIVVIVVLIKKYDKQNTVHQGRRDDRPELIVMDPLIDKDIDLTPYISEIAREMTLKEVRSFVRNQSMPRGMIDQSIEDNLHDSAEQKIALLNCWYEYQGKRGAYKTLVNTLRKLNLHATAEKLQQKISDSQNIAADQNITFLDENPQ